MFPHAMIDIETLGTKPDSVILSIGVVLFDRHAKEVGPELLLILDAKSQIRDGRKIDLDTVVFWMQQKPESAAHFTDAYKAKTFTDNNLACLELKGFLQGVEEFWAKSPQFDMVLLENLIAGTPPWKYSQLRDVRTAIALSGKEVPGKPTHDPVADCHLQIQQLFEVL